MYSNSKGRRSGSGAYDIHTTLQHHHLFIPPLPPLPTFQLENIKQHLSLHQALDRQRVLTDPFSAVAEPSSKSRSRAAVLAEVVDAFRSRAAARQTARNFALGNTTKKAKKVKEEEAARAAVEASGVGKDGPAFFLMDVKEVRKENNGKL